MSNPRLPITAPPAAPPAYGLLRVAPTIDGLEPRVFGAGWTFQPEACGADRGGILELDCGRTDPMDAEFGPGPIDGDPFVIYAWDKCSTFGFDARDWMGRAQRMLRAVESYWLATALWDGPSGFSLAQGQLAAAAADVLTVGAVGIVAAIGLVEGAMAQLYRGQPGMVHMTTQALTHAIAAYAVYRDGALWRTASGNVVVADAGYSGNGPTVDAGASQWVYGSPVVSVALGAVEVNPATLDQARDLAAMIDHHVNTAVVYAARPATWVWDAEACGIVAAELSVAIPLIGGVS